jgi:guanylate kinase
MEKKGILTIVSGFSGVGKGTMIKELLAKHDNYFLSVSATTRNPRPGEEEGIHYFFITSEEFEKRIEADAFLEYAKYVNNSYGTPRELVEQKLAAGYDVLLEIEIQGAMQVKEKLPEAFTVFVMPPSAEELKNRLVGRNTETMEVINERLKRAKEEAEGIEWYDSIVVNDDLEISVETLHQLIQAKHNEADRNEKFINKIREGVKAFSEGE